MTLKWGFKVVGSLLSVRAILPLFWQKSSIFDLLYPGNAVARRGAGRPAALGAAPQTPGRLRRKNVAGGSAPDPGGFAARM